MSAGSPATLGPYDAQANPTTDSAGCPVSSSQARFTQLTRSAASSQNIGSRACCQTWSGLNAETRGGGMRNGLTWVRESEHNRRSPDPGRSRRTGDGHAGGSTRPHFRSRSLRPEAKARKKRETWVSLMTRPIGAWPWRRAIALDGGTTNTRARLVQDGRIVATARREVGVRDTVLGDGASGRRGCSMRCGKRSSRSSSAGDSSVDAELIVAAGMLTSEVGLVAVPHAPAPAGLSELADAMVVRTIPEIGPWPIHFVPGIRTPAEAGPDGWMRADVMRGEECETSRGPVPVESAGTPGRARGGHVFLWPGSHTKLVEVDRLGRITRSQTSLAGELLQAIARHTLIAASLPSRWPEHLDLDAAEAGARAVRDQGLERAGVPGQDRGAGGSHGPGSAGLVLGGSRGRRRHQPPRRTSDPGAVAAGLGRGPGAAAPALRPLAGAVASRSGQPAG